MNKYKEISYNTIIFAIGNIGVKLIQFVLLPILTLKLTDGDLSTSDVLTSTIELLVPMLTLGLAESVFRFSINTEYDKKSVFNNSLVVSLIGMAPVLIAVTVLHFTFPQEFWYLFSVLYALTALNGIFGNYVRGIDKVKTFAFSAIAQALCLLLFSVIFVYVLNYGLIGYLLAMIIAYAVRIGALIIFGKVYKSFSVKSLDKKLLKIMILYALPTIPNNISWWVVQALSKYLCKIYFSPALSDAFSAASKLPAVINMLANIFLQAWSISAAKTVNDEEKGKFNSIVFKYFSAFVMLCASAVFVVLPYVSHILLKGATYSGWIYSALLIFAAVLTCYSSYFGAFYSANFKTVLSFISTLAGAVVNIAVSFAFINLIGVYALLLASCLTYLTIVIVRMATTKKYSQIKINYFKEIASLLIVLAQALIITFLRAIWWAQLIGFVVLFAVRITDIISIFKVFIGLFKKKKTEPENTENVEAVTATETGETADAETEENKEIAEDGDKENEI